MKSSENYDKFDPKVKLLRLVIIEKENQIIRLKNLIQELDARLFVAETINPPKRKSYKSKKTYLIKNKRNNLYKIGRSTNPKKREKTLQSEEPLIEIVKTWDNDIENTLHKCYSKQRIRGEWFKLNNLQIKHICTNY